MARQIAGFSNTRQVGNSLEAFASRFLKRQGFQLLQKNYQCRVGEIDLIMLDAEGVLVFVEIRFRNGTDFGSAISTVDARKRHKIRRTASHYLLRNPTQAQRICRFDVLGITPDSGGKGLHIDWVRNAFY